MYMSEKYNKNTDHARKAINARENVYTKDMSVRSTVSTRLWER